MFLHTAAKRKKAPLRPTGPIKPGKPHERLRLSLRVIVMVLAVILGVAVFFSKLLSNEVELLDSQLSEQSASALDTAANRYTEAAVQNAREVNFSNKSRQERCAMLGVLLDTYDTADALPDWDTVAALFDAEQVWLLDGAGGLLRGDALPEGLTRQQLSEKRTVSDRQISAIELGEKGPSMNSLELLLRSLGLSADQIFYPELTEKYLAVLAEMNRRIAARADRVYEVVCGIPIEWKGGSK